MLKLRTFSIDVTPPVGDFLCGGLHDRSIGIETPLCLRGLIFSTASDDYLIASIDFCYLCGRSYRRLLGALAEGAGIPPAHATLHANHLHDAPLIDEEAHGLIAEHAPGLLIHNEDYFSGILDRTRSTLRQVRATDPVPLASIAFSQHAVDRFASSRRVLGDDGRCRVRWSVCRDNDVRNAPEGVIDPMLDMLVFYDADNSPVACASFYASHPQVSDGRRLISSDTVGVARDLFEYAFPGVFHVHFDGCGGDVTAGKYSTENRRRNRLVFGVRMFDAMEEAFRKARPQPVDSMAWIDETQDIPLAPVPETEEKLLRIVCEDEWRSNKYVAATKLLRKNRSTYPYRTTRLAIGDAGVLFLPAEMCVEYQLYAKRQCRGPLAVAAYGDCALKYIATDAAFDEGGYEVEPKWTEVGRGIEIILKERIKAILPR